MNMSAVYCSRRATRRATSATEPSVDLGSPGIHPPAAAPSPAENDYAPTPVDKSLGNVQRPSATSSNDAAGTADDVNDITLIDNDLYDRQGQVLQGQPNNTSADYECTLIDNDLYR